MKCPNCGAEEDDLDFWMGDDGTFYWNCFDCEHKWEVKHETKR